MKFNNTSEATVYDNIRNKLGHDTEESTITLLKDFADLEIRDSESQPPNADANQRVALNKINAIYGYKSSLDRYVQRLKSWLEDREFIRIFCKKVLLYFWETLKNKK